MSNVSPKLTRRTLLTLAIAPLAGCGDGELIGFQLPGTTGTGIVALASISGFGSVIVGGQTYDETAATISIDGQTASRTDLRLGMTAYLTGTWPDGADTGLAQQIDVWRSASGTLASVSSSSCVLHGSTYTWDDNTIWEGVTETTLQTGQTVVLWGLQANSTATQWHLTRVALDTGSPPVITGKPTQNGGIWRINGIQLIGLPAQLQAPDKLLWVQGTPIDANGLVWSVTATRLAPSTDSIDTSRLLHLEGVVTGIAPDGRLILGDQLLDTSTLANVPKPGQRIQVNARHGSDGRLHVSSIDTPGSSGSGQPLTRLSGKVENWRGQGDFTVQGQRCNALSARGNIGALQPGAWVALKGVRTGQILNVTEVASKTEARTRPA